MLKEYFHSEAGFYFSRKRFYVILLLFWGLGYFVSVKAGFSFPGVYLNSPYVLTYAIGLISLINIFTITILAAQILLREKDAHFDAILYTTPLNKKNFLLSRFGLILFITVLSYFLFVLGFMTGHIMQGNNIKFTNFHFLNYLYPFLVLVLPNAILCTAIVSTASWLSKNKMFIYLSGLFIYILYMMVSLFSNSPLIANASPVSADTISLMAKLDPFGMAAFFEQTKTWPPSLRNTQLVQLQGNFLLNRIAILLVSTVLLFLSQRWYRFTTGKKEKNSNRQTDNPRSGKSLMAFKPVLTKNTGSAYHWRTLWSFVISDTRSIVKSKPFVLVVIVWAFFLGMEIYSDIDAGIRLPQRYATTGLMAKNIMGSFSFFILAVLLFYGVEMLWRSQNVKIDALEHTTPVNTSTILAAKCMALAIVPLLLICFSILYCAVLQYLFHYPHIKWNVYAGLFYVLGIPAILGAVMIISIQAITGKKYAGLVLAAIFMVVTNTFVGTMLGLQHPLFRFARSFLGNYSDMNGFGAYLDAFTVKMLYWTAFTLIVGLLAGKIWGADNRSALFAGIKQLNPATCIIAAVCFITLIGSGRIITNKTVVKSKSAQANWQQAYEQTYRSYQHIPQPGIKAVKTNIDLFPDQNRYTIKGHYTLVNKNTVPLDSFLLYCNRSVVLKNIKIENAMLTRSDAPFGHYIYSLLKPWQPGDTINMQFEIDYSWSPYNPHDPVNSIVENGAFMRISRYYPVFGYQSGNEIEDDADRQKRQMATATRLKKPEDKNSGLYDYGFINFEAVISTTEKQTAIGTGELVTSWTENGRNYFHYRSPVPIPFRFAVSSAEYEVKKVSQNGVSIAVYYHPDHAENVAHLIEEARNTLVYCEKNFGRYPYKSISFAEISGFTEGFAATAYPASIFMSENVVFHADIRKGDKRDVINELAGHELSHEWWGNNQIAPEEREGAAMLTETLAMYTELMLYKQTHGTVAMQQVVAMHQSIYDNGKVYSTNEPLYKVQPGNVYLSYNKGVVVMYELYKLIGEEKINCALKNFLARYAYPNKPPTSVDLINEFLKVSNPAVHEKIRQLFIR